MANNDAVRSTNEITKSTCQLQIKLIPAETEEPEVDLVTHSRKRCKTENYASSKVEIHIQKKSSMKKPVINGKNGADEQQKWCHQCRSNKGSHVIECKKCQSKKYCVECIYKWYPNLSKEEFVKACPFCRNNCNCKACLRGCSLKGYSCSKPDKIRYSKHIIQKVLPFVRRLNEEQLIEKEIEAKVKGLSVSELQLQEADCEVDDDIYCDNCGAYFFDLYRSCACGYDLCLVCCRDLRDGGLNKGSKGAKCGWKLCTDGRIPCPPKDIGGCNDGILELKHIMRVDWVVNTLEKAKGIYKINTSDDIDIPQTSTKCGMCYLSVNEVIPDIQPQDMQHFQLHWSKGEPVIVNDVLSTSLGLSWEPMVLWRAFRDITKNRNLSQVYVVNAIDCLDWSEVSVDLYKFFKGYIEGRFGRAILKLEDWQPSYVYEGELPRHFVELIGCLPFKDYTHPQNGYLNVAVKLPDISLKPDVGPRMDIAYGVEEELENGNSVTKLHYDKSDTVNVLTHTQSPLPTSTKVYNTKMVKQKHGDQDEALVCDEGALWDIFRRQDIPKLEKYLRNHSEFCHADCLSAKQIVHPIHDRVFYLNMEHKRKLKEEFGIEPWTFKQKLGDAVFIPAGCPYQVRNLKIGKMMLYALDHAVVDFAGANSNEPIGELQFVKGRRSAITQPTMVNTRSVNGSTKGSSKSSGQLKRKLHFVKTEEPEVDPPIIKKSSKRSSVYLKDPPHQTVEFKWRGNAVGRGAKELFEAIEQSYPTTFQGAQIRVTQFWLNSLNELHVAIKRFMGSSVDALLKEDITGFHQDFKDFESLGFDLSWAHQRLEMVARLKFGNEPLQKEFMALQQSLGPLKERVMRALSEHKNATKARNKKAEEMAREFGPDFDRLLKEHLGFGMLRGY